MDKQTRKNLIMFPIGTIGRDMIYQLFTNFIMLYILYTRNLTVAQLGAVTGIMVAARVFDALNDPVMGNIIERTRSRWGKFKPWLAIGVLSTSVVVYLAFNTSLEGWSFIVFFGVIYFLYSITFTMHDISYWGMIPAMSSDGDTRNRFTSRASLFAGIGGTAASVLVPLLTTGEHALGGSARIAYGRIALIFCLLAPVLICFTLFGAKEARDDKDAPVPPVSFGKIIGTITGNPQLVWISVIFLIQQIGNGIVLGGVGSNYIYFEFGYEGGLYSTFTTIGMMATAVLMVFYPMLSRHMLRRKQVSLMAIVSLAGYVLMLASGLLLPATMVKFWLLTVGYMAANLGQYGLYLIMMISIINTVEYNEYLHGVRDEAIITSMRPYLTKLGSALVVVITYLTYVMFRVNDFTNRISDLERSAEIGTVTASEKSAQIAAVLSEVAGTQTIGLLVVITVVPCVLMLISVALYQKHYIIDEKYYEELCAELEKRRG